MIRVTPTGDEPVELPEETPAVSVDLPGGSATERSDVDVDIAYPASDEDEAFVLRERPQTLARVARSYEAAFVRIGDAWLLCEIETWRARAERLERDLDDLRAASRPARRYCEACQDRPGGCAQCCPEAPLAAHPEGARR